MKRRYRVRLDFIGDLDGDPVQINSHLQVCDHEPFEVNTGILTADGAPIVYTIEPNPIGFFHFEEVDDEL